MIKRILTVLLTLTMLASLFAGITVWAAGEATVSISNEPGLGGVTVSGTVSATKANKIVVFRLVDENDNEVYMKPTKTYKENGVIKFNFGTILFPTDFPSGDYTILISGEDIAQMIEETYVFAPRADVVAALGAVKTATETENASVGNALKSGKNAKILGVDIKDYDAISAKTGGKEEFESIMKTATYETVTAESSSELITAQGNKIKEIYAKAIAAAYFMVAETSTDVQNWYNRFYSALGFDIETAPDNQKVTPILETVKGTEEFANYIAKFSGNKTIDEIKDHIYKSAILAAIIDRTPSRVKDLLVNFSDIYFKGDGFQIDWAGFAELDLAEQTDVIDDLKLKKAETCQATVAALNELIDKKLNPDDEGGNGGGNGGGGGSFGGGSKTEKPVYMENPEPVEVKEGFPDIESVDWAREAIEYLYSVGIVNGNPDGTFAPDNNVTRAEFIKMVIVAMGISDIEGECPFGDVAADSWYASYVEKAYKAGIVSGDENGNFNPDVAITRQDIVTILYRALDMDITASASFKDADSISDYAKDAVGYFASKGIVNGYEDGSFGPQNNATRAETATIIYRIIKD